MRAALAKVLAESYEDPFTRLKILAQIKVFAAHGFTNTCLRYHNPKLKDLKRIKKELQALNYEVWITDAKDGVDVQW